MGNYCLDSIYTMNIVYYFISIISPKQTIKEKNKKIKKPIVKIFSIRGC